MNKSNKKYKLNYLSLEFYKKYNSVDYPEIENKETRPYMVMLIQIENNTFAVPFRTNVRHSSCYKFKKSTRSSDSVTGLDYSKAVIVNDPKYIGSAARINDAEYIELDQNHHFIIKKFTKFVKGYIDFLNGNLDVHQAGKYKYTTLKYFKNELLRVPEHMDLDEQIECAHAITFGDKPATKDTPKTQGNVL